MDRRVRYTKNVIKETLISLLSEKKINKITVTEVCKIADINRATFYRYYLDIYDLYDHMEQEFLDELKEATKVNHVDTVYTFSEEILDVLLRNKQLVKVLFSSNGNLNFLNEILEISYNKCILKWTEDSISVNEQSEYASVFIFNGALGVVNYWVKNDFDKEISEIAQTIQQLSYYGIKKYIYGQ